MNARSLPSVRRRVVPAVEALEDRSLLALVTATLINPVTLRIQGTEGDDTIEIIDRGLVREGDYSVEVVDYRRRPRVGHTGFVAPGRLHIFIDMKGGRDTVTYRSEGVKFDATNPRGLVVNLGAGDDKFDWYMSGVQFLANSSLTLFALGGQGADTMRVSTGAGTLDSGARVAMFMLGGSEKDTLRVGPQHTVPATSLTLNSGARWEVTLAGGPGSYDKVEFLYDFSYAGRMDGDLFVRLAGDPGIDTVLATIKAPPGLVSVYGNLRAEVFGGLDADTLSLFVPPSAQFRSVDALLDGGYGQDTCNASSNVKVLNCP